MSGGERRITDVYWSYRPESARIIFPAELGKVPKKGIPVAIGVRATKLTDEYWHPLMMTGRAVIGASGWYEWTGPKGIQRWHVLRKDREPVFMLALANFGPAGERPEETGSVIVTRTPSDGMAGVRDGRPVVVSAVDAARWLDPALAPVAAAELARRAMADADAFEWGLMRNTTAPVSTAGFLRANGLTAPLVEIHL